MLSRRRSSEQASQSTHSQSTPSITRIESAVRNAHVLFWTPIASDAARPSLPRPDASGELPHTDTSAMRRLFAREPRARRPPAHRLVVAATHKHAALRLYHVVDAARVAVHRSWNLADLRKIDGLGEPVSDATRFALFFGTPKPVAFRTATPHARATFLWSLLQACVSRLKRAPPVTHLRLLDLQTMADEEQPAAATYDALPLRASLDDLVSDAHTHASDASAHRPSTMHTASTKREQRPDQAEPDARRNASRRPTTPNRLQKVARTLSEPKAIAMPPLSDETDAVQPASTETAVKDMNIDERAFLAAAKRMGAKRSFEMRRDANDRFSSVGSDPKARLFQNRIKMSDANTAKVVAERRLQQEKKHFRLSLEEQTDLAFALELFGKQNADAKLQEFGPWAEAHIQQLEMENIADLVNVEKRAPEYEVGKAGAPRAATAGAADDRNPQDVLVESMTFAEPWLKKCETRLAPYASLAEEINKEIILLEIQRRNAQHLEEDIDGLLSAISFEEEEQALISDLDTIDVSFEAADVNYKQFHQAVQLITKKGAALSKLPTLSDMVAVRNVQQMIAEKQNNASTALLPILKSFLSKFYDAEETSNFNFSFDEPWITGSDASKDDGLVEFLRGAECLAVCGNNSFVELIDHYVSVSSAWVANFLRLLMQEDVGVNMVKTTLDKRARLFGENLLYICLVEGFRAFRLFAGILDSSDRDGFISISAILRRQITDAKFVEEYVTAQAEGNKVHEACIHLHFCHSLERFAEEVKRCTDEELLSKLTMVETRNGVGGDADLAKKDGNSSSSASRHITRSDRVVRESVSNFVVVCNESSLTCHALVEKHVGDVIAHMSAPRDIAEELGRAAFFTRVKEAVDLCCDLSSPAFRGIGSTKDIEVSSDKTKSLCERLIAAAMRSTEIASTSGPESTTDSVKLQCYGYIAAKLGEGEREDFLVQLAHLSSRVRKHVMTRWAESAIFDTVLGSLNLDNVNRTTETYSKFRTTVMDLTAQRTTERIKDAISDAMESAQITCAILPFYSELISLTKEKMEDVLRRVRKDKAVSDVRPKLLSFSRELLGNLRGELRRLQELTDNQEL